MKTETKLEIVRFGLRGMGFFLIFIGLSKLLFPALAHKLVGQKSFIPHQPFMNLASREMGILFFVFGIGSLIAAFDPIRHRYLVFLVVLSSILSDIDRLSATTCERLWIVILVSVFFWLLIVLFYPYNLFQT